MKFIPHHDSVWHRVGGEDGPQPHPSPAPNCLLTLEQWHAVRDHHWPADLPTGLLVPNTLDVETLAADLPRLALLVLQFPKWTDGRAYSQGHVLKARLRYQGEVRATGDVLVDMMPLLQRCGFNAVALRGDQDRGIAERQLGFFAARGHYQGDVVATKPVFGRAA